MAKKQSFDLSEGKDKRDFREQKYKYRWVRYLTFPFLIGFILLLILPSIRTNDCFQSSPDNITITYKLSSHNNETDIEVYQTRDVITCVIEDCNIICNDGDIKDFGKTIESLNQGCSNLVVDITNGKFPDNRIKKSWLEGMSTANVITLRIYACELKEIEDGAMELVKNLKTLHLISVQLKELKLYSFKFLMNVEELIIENSNENFVGDKFLSCVAPSIKYFSFYSLVKPLTAVNPEAWFLMGSYYSLKTLNLTSNNFADKLKLTSFSDFKVVENVILDSCWISSLNNDVFDAIRTTLKSIDLRNNRLKTLSEILINKFESPTKILIEGNPWECTCDVDGFVYLYRNNVDIFDANVRCASPDNYKNKSISDPSVCGVDSTSTTTIIPTDPSTSTTSSTTTISSTTTTTEVVTDPEEDKPKLIPIACKSNLIATPSIIYVQENDVNFTISMLSYTSVRLKIESNAGNVIVLWFYTDLDSENRFVTECLENVSNDLIVTDLKQNQTYTFCIITNDNYQISPFNCQGYYTNIKLDPTPTLPDDGIHVTCNVQKLTIILLSIGIFLALIAGGLTVFLLIRWRPTLLKGNKRLIFLNKSQTNVLVMPQNGCAKSKTCTATNPTVSRSKSYPNDERRRRMSDISICSGKSYILPNMYEAIEYQKKMEYEIATDRVYFEEFPTNSPPPLPKRSSQPDENNYIHFSEDYA